MVASVQSATESITSANKSLTGNYEMFLSLLTTQLKNQDPLDPLDNNQFTQQLTAMTGVQQQLLTNELLTQLLGQGQADLGGGAVNLIGKQVSVTSEVSMLENGNVGWNYAIDGEAATTKLQVYDGDGNLVFEAFADDNKAGEHAFSWDGKAASGKTMPDGAYFLKVTPTNTDGTVIGSTVTYTGIASGLATVDGQTMLTVGKIAAPLTSVTAVRQAPTT